MELRTLLFLRGITQIDIVNAAREAGSGLTPPVVSNIVRRRRLPGRGEARGIRLALQALGIAPADIDDIPELQSTRPGPGGRRKATPCK